MSVIVFLLLYVVYLFVWRSLKDGIWIRCLAFLYFPAIALFLMFGTLFIVNCVLQIVGPVAHIRRNSQWYSAIPAPQPEDRRMLPSVTVQIPVYKESLEGVIVPSLRSILKAVRYYIRKGGKANVFINDDGLQLVDNDERARRIAFYERHGLAYVARPPHDVRERRGLFKKASNMNYCLNVATKVEENMLAAEQRGRRITPAEALYQVWSSKYYNKEFLAGGDVRVGDLVLLVDADTRVPKQCMWKSAPEFVECENLAFTQHLTFP
jgi:cellulose synthase/poly-beta-1,6-N-acetylglucosamine synthase-like glycosyltransferase